MRKIVFLSSLLLILLLAISTPVSAALTKQIKIPTIIKGTTESIQRAIDSIIARIDNHDSKILELEAKIKALEEKVAKLEAKIIIDDDIQSNQEIKESNESIPLNQLQQDSSSLNQRINEFLTTSSSQLTASEFIAPNGPEIKDLGDVKLK